MDEKALSVSRWFTKAGNDLLTDDWREIPLDEAREAVGSAKQFSDFVRSKIVLT